MSSNYVVYIYIYESYISILWYIYSLFDDCEGKREGRRKVNHLSTQLYTVLRDSWSPLSHQKFKILNSNSDRQKKNRKRERETRVVFRGEEKIFEERVTR